MELLQVSLGNDLEHLACAMLQVRFRLSMRANPKRFFNGSGEERSSQSCHESAPGWLTRPCVRTARAPQVKPRRSQRGRKPARSELRLQWTLDGSPSPEASSPLRLESRDPFSRTSRAVAKARRLAMRLRVA
jgi:hypothetical protein